MSKTVHRSRIRLTALSVIDAYDHNYTAKEFLNQFISNLKIIGIYWLANSIKNLMLSWQNQNRSQSSKFLQPALSRIILQWQKNAPPVVSLVLQTLPILKPGVLF